MLRSAEQAAVRGEWEQRFAAGYRALFIDEVRIMLADTFAWSDDACLQPISVADAERGTKRDALWARSRR